MGCISSRCSTSSNVALPPDSASNSTLYFRRLSGRARTPIRSGSSDAGIDLASAYQYRIGAFSRRIIYTDLQILLPPGCYGRIAPRSGYSARTGSIIGAGVVDPDYHGNVGILLYNLSSQTLIVSPGDYIAQLVCERICVPIIEEDEFLYTRPGQRFIAFGGVSLRDDDSIPSSEADESPRASTSAGPAASATTYC